MGDRSCFHHGLRGRHLQALLPRPEGRPSPGIRRNRLSRCAGEAAYSISHMLVADTRTVLRGLGGNAIGDGVVMEGGVLP